MKPTFLDRVIGWINPEAGYRRMQYKAASTELTRGYDGANSYAGTEWKSAHKTSANAEIGPARATLVAKSRDLGRNNPYSVRATNVIVTNTVGAGIVANIKGKNKTQVKKLTALWNQVAKSTLCDVEGRKDFYGMQAMAMRAIVESGEVLALKNITPTAPSLRLIESDYIVAYMDNGIDKIQGIEINDTGVPQFYNLYKRHPGDMSVQVGTLRVAANQLLHVFKQERPGQLRGVPWSHSVIEKLKNFDDYQYSTLMRQKIAACFAGFITDNGSDSALTSSQQKAKLERDFQMIPGMIRRLAQGESYQHSTPPGVDGAADFNRDTLRSVAIGYGITYESLTGDHSQVNFSSGRMGHLDMQRNIDTWRWQMLIPGFCDPYFQMFLEWAKAKGYDTDGASAEWTPPAREMIDPTKEIDALKAQVRAGFKSLPEAIREQGADPEQVLTEIAESNAKLDEAKLVLDTDPRKVTQQGMTQIEPNPPPDGQGNSDNVPEKNPKAP